MEDVVEEGKRVNALSYVRVSSWGESLEFTFLGKVEPLGAFMQLSEMM